MIKFLAGSCLSELGIVLKEPLTIYFMDENLCLSRDIYEWPGQVLSLRALIHEFFQQKFNYTRSGNILKSLKYYKKI